jgi:hypothetical protein
MTETITHECVYCDATEFLRIYQQDPWGKIHALICEECFRDIEKDCDYGPYWDDLTEI